MAKPLRVLLVEDQSSDAEMTLLELRLAGLDPQSTVVADEADYRKGLTGDPEIIICDHYLPTFDSIRALEILKDSRRDIPFIVVSGAIREDEAVECMKRGAADYLLKDRLARIGQAVKHALESKRLRDEHRRAEASLRFLSELSAQMLETLDYDKRLEALSQAVTSSLADWCVIHALGQDGVLRETEIAHRDPAKRELACEVARRFPLDPNQGHGPYGVLKSGLPEIIGDVDEVKIAEVTNDPEIASILRQVGITSVICVPLQRRGAAFGTMSLVAAGSGRRFDSADLALAEEIGRRASIALENARLFREAQESLRCQEAALAEAERLHQEAHRANRLKDDFLATVSHELLAGISPDSPWPPTDWPSPHKGMFDTP